MPNPAADEDMQRLAQRLAEAGARVEPVLESLFPRRAPDCLSEPFWHHTSTGGKRVRPALCLLCCEALGGDVDAALPFAAAVEILHNMFLVHDDIEDGDRVRRDEPTVWVKYGLANGVNLGDYMTARAYSAVLRCPVDAETLLRLTAAFTDTFERTCRGQALDINCRGRADFTVDRYMEMATLKTGHYLALGMVGGAIVAGLGEEGVRAIQELGGNMGPAFQMRDDVIDLTLGKGRGGMRGCDIREGKPSILFAHALTYADEAERDRLLGIARRERDDVAEDDVEWAMALYDRLGSVDFARAKADELVTESFATIERIPVPDKEFFRRVARFMAERTT